MKNIQKILVYLIMAICGASIPLSTYFAIKENVRYEIIKVPVEKVVTETKIKYIPVFHIYDHETEYIENIIYQPESLMDWQSPEELQAFIDLDTSTYQLIITSGEEFNNQCENYALQMIDSAAEQGKRLFLVPLNYKEYSKWYQKSIPSDSYHAVCGAIIGNDFWYIDPLTKKSWLALHLD